VEDAHPGRAPLLAALAAAPRRGRVLGVTGPPGAGKSTLVESFTRRLRGQGRTVGVLAVDPSSPLTGGALLGDRIRMQAHATDAGVFIRSMAARGQLGGLSAAADDAIAVLAAGRDVVLVETVGVGQGEVDVAEAADVTLVVLVPGLGDEVQVLKAGLLEVADVLVVNKADREGADRLQAELALLVESRAEGAVPPPVVATVALRDEGVGEALAAAEAVPVSGQAEARRRLRARRRLERALLVRLRAAASEGSSWAASVEREVDRLLARATDPATAADALLREMGFEA
jgi:LAO/AO transport system kinase